MYKHCLFGCWAWAHACRLSRHHHHHHLEGGRLGQPGQQVSAWARTPRFPPLQPNAQTITYPYTSLARTTTVTSKTEEEQEKKREPAHNVCLGIIRELKHQGNINVTRTVTMPHSWKEISDTNTGHTATQIVMHKWQVWPAPFQFSFFSKKSRNNNNEFNNNNDN